MASEARALLDEQIEALNALRVAASAAFGGAGLLYFYARLRDARAAASQLSRLVDGLEKLNQLWESSGHLLRAANPVRVPIPMLGDVEFPSACSGAVSLLLSLLEWSIVEFDQWRTATSSFEDAVTQGLQQYVPEWLLLVSSNEMGNLADAVNQEADAAIERVTRVYLESQAAGGEDSSAKQSEGPQPPNLLYLDGKAIPLNGNTFKIISHLWNRLNRTASYDDLCVAVWTDEEAISKRLPSAVSRANEELIEKGILLEIVRNRETKQVTLNSLAAE